MERKVITNANAPNPIGAYNQAVISNGFVFTAGQIGLNPETGKIVEESFKARVEQVFKNLSAILETAGTDLSKVVKFKAPIFNKSKTINDGNRILFSIIFFIQFK
mgnify:CR=1 FL=1